MASQRSCIEIRLNFSNISAGSRDKGTSCLNRKCKLEVSSLYYNLKPHKFSPSTGKGREALRASRPLPYDSFRRRAAFKTIYRIEAKTRFSSRSDGDFGFLGLVKRRRIILRPFPSASSFLSYLRIHRPNESFSKAEIHECVFWFHIFRVFRL